MQVKHKMYYYNRIRGLSTQPCAKCLCGADLRGPTEIAQHEDEIDRVTA